VIRFLIRAARCPLLPDAIRDHALIVAWLIDR
jgi:hypothetical protein